MKFKKNSLPIDYKDRLKYLYRFQETLRLFHNKKGQDFRDGKMTEDEFRHFQKEWFKKRNRLVNREINNCTGKIQELIDEQKLPEFEEHPIIATYKESKKDANIHITITDIEEE